jgi:hypothetical protein
MSVLDPNLVTWKEYSEFHIARRQLDRWRTVEQYDRLGAARGDREAQTRYVREKAINDAYEKKHVAPFRDRFADRTGRPINPQLRGELLDGKNALVDIDRARNAALDSHDDQNRLYYDGTNLHHWPVDDGSPHVVTAAEVEQLRRWMHKDQALDKAYEAVMRAREESVLAGTAGHEHASI